MKLTKKSISILLVAIMLIACAIPVFAQTKTSGKAVYVHRTNSGYSYDDGGWFKLDINDADAMQRMTTDKFGWSAFTNVGNKVYIPYYGIVELDLESMKYTGHFCSEEEKDAFYEYSIDFEAFAYDEKTRSAYTMMYPRRLVKSTLESLTIADINNAKIVGGNEISGSIAAMDFDKKGELYGIYYSRNSGEGYQLVKINPNNCEMQIVGNTSVMEALNVDYHFMKYDAESDTFYWLVPVRDDTILYSVDKNSGNATELLRLGSGAYGGMIIADDDLTFDEPERPVVEGNIYGFRNDGIISSKGWVNLDINDIALLGEPDGNKYNEGTYVSDAKYYNGSVYYYDMSSGRSACFMKMDMNGRFEAEPLDSLNEKINQVISNADGARMGGFEFGNDGVLYIFIDVYNYENAKIYSYNFDKDEIEQVSSLDGYTYFSKLMNVNGEFYGISGRMMGDEANMQLEKINVKTGKHSVVGKINLGYEPSVSEFKNTSSSLVYDGKNNTAYFEYKSVLYKINLKNAKLERIGKIGGVDQSITALIICNDEIEVSYKKGDANGDNIVDSADATTVLRYVAKLENLSEAKLKAGDVNGDGEVDSSDATVILRFVAGLENLE